MAASSPPNEQPGALRSIRPVELVDTERKRMAGELLADVRRIDNQLHELKNRIAQAVAASGTSVIEVHEVGPIVAAILIGHSGDPRAVPQRRAPRPLRRHRSHRSVQRTEDPASLQPPRQPANSTTPSTSRRSPRSPTTPPGKSPKEALRVLKRRVSDAVYRQLIADSQR